MAVVALGMSGGVDSCAAAILLKEKGFDIKALYFDVIKDNDSSSRRRAEAAAKALDIEFIYRDCSDEFEEKIISYFCNEYKCGRTPSPCVFCNPLIKFKLLAELETDYIATGHYAGIAEKSGVYYVRKAADRLKDQSYMLARLPRDILSKTIFPLADISSKEETRRIVGELKLEAAESKDSQDICFISGSYKDFLACRGISSVKGNFIDKNGRILGPNTGVANYTLGQRKGLGIALGEPAFVCSLNSVSGDICLTTQEKDLFRTEVLIRDIMLTDPDLLLYKNQYGLSCKLRYAAKAADCSISMISDSRALLTFTDPQRAPTPGQLAVIYKDDIVIGSGIIYN